MLFLILIVTLAQQASGAASQIKRSPIFSAVGTGEYFSNTYLERKAGNAPHFILFVGEPIKLKIAIGNPGPDELAFRFAGITADDMFSVDVMRDGVPVRVALSFDGGRGYLATGGEFAFEVKEATHFKPLDKVEWMAEVDEALLPGVYRIRIAPNAFDEKGRPIRPNVSFYDFEIRPRSRSAEPEILRRAALRHYVTGHPSELEKASAAIDRLLEIHPNSYEGFLIRGNIARARGDEETAAANYRRARSILENDQDLLLLKTMSRNERARLQAFVDGLAKRK